MKTFLILVLCWLGLSLSAHAAVNINTANQTELESLPGIGPVRAKAILEYRKKNGGFKSVDELTRVDGIGPVTLKNARNDIVLDTNLTSKPAASSASLKNHTANNKALKPAMPAPNTPAPTTIKTTTPITTTQPKRANMAIIVPAKPVLSQVQTKPATSTSIAPPSKLAPAKAKPFMLKDSETKPSLSEASKINSAKKPDNGTKPSAIKPQSEKAAPK